MRCSSAEEGATLTRHCDRPADRDGTIDMVLTTCSSDGKCNLSIAYNSQMPLCTPHGPSLCRDAEALCVADDKFTFDFSSSADNDVRLSSTSHLQLADAFVQRFTSIPIATLIPGASLITESTAFRGLLPTPPSIGDYNIDGYPDLLILTSQSGSRVAALLESRPCDRASCTPAEVSKGRRAFRVRTDGAEALTKITDVESVHWMDMDDDVRLLLAAVWMGRELTRGFRRGRSTLWSSARARRALRGTLCSSRTTTSTTPFSSRHSVG